MSQFDITSNVNSKGVSAEEKEHLYKQVMWEGTRASAIAAAVATGASVAAHRLSPSFRNIRLPFKTFLVLAATTGTFFTVSDRASIRASRTLASQRSGSVLDVSEPIVGAREWVIRHRYPLVMTLWSGTLAGAILYNWRRGDITKSQKLINARLVAQVMALAGVGGIAGLAGTAPYEEHVDKHFEKIMEAGEDAQRNKRAAAK
ncbi:hypothetical protein HDU86_005104 [Geranomyces michiganensis]|nr:hypothetical protein HDU86_005104 [Geranomyces michiganensis]